MFSKFFIDRPIFATVLALLIVVAGLVTLGILPIAQYPDITPPTVQVSAVYPGANAQTVAQTVGIPIEQQVNGVDGMLYMSSNSSSSGAYSLTVTFAVGTDIDMATVQVQNRVSVAQSSLPTPVVVQGVTVQKQSSNIVMFLTMKSDNKDYDGLYLSNYAKLNLVDQLTRVPGVGAVNVMGAGDYSMRIWLDPAAMRIRNLSPADVYQAIQTQNVEVSAGNVGQPIGNENKNAYQYSLTVKGRLTSPEEFGNIILRTESGGRILRLRDVAHIDLGSASYSVVSQLDGRPTAAIAIYQQPGSNSLDVSTGVKAKMQELSQNFPAGVQYNVTLDTTDVIHASIDEVMVTFFETTLLVVLVIFLFLQNWRAVIIPCITIPVSLIGTLAIMSLFGFSINTLTLFGLILAVAIVVDDAIVVLENVTTHIERGSDPKQAAVHGTNEVAISVVASTLTMIAVFFPLTMVTGMSGVLFKQLGWMMCAIMFVSTVSALTLTPMLCSQLLRLQRKQSKMFRIFFGPIEHTLDGLDNWYARMLNWAVRHRMVVLVGCVIFFILSLFCAKTIGTEFFPAQDNARIAVQLELPIGTRKEVAQEVSQKLTNQWLQKYKGVMKICNYTVGQADSDNTWASMQDNGSHIISFNISLVDPADRDVTLETVCEEMREDLKAYPEFSKAQVIFGGSNTGMSAQASADFEVYGYSMEETDSVAARLKRELLNVKGVSEVNISRSDYQPEYQVDFDREKLALHGLNLSTAATYLRNRINGATASKYREDGDEYDIKVRYAPEYRTSLESIENILVYNAKGEGVRIKDLGKVVERFAPPTIERKDRERIVTVSAVISGAPLGDVVAAGNAIIDRMEKPSDITIQVAGSFEDQQDSFRDLGTLGVLIIILVFIVMAAQFESLTYPFILILSVPFAMSGVLMALFITNTTLSVMSLLGSIMLIGIVVKNGIVLIDYTILCRERGQSVLNAVVTAGKSRLRPVLMTTMTTILGMIPMAISSGQGSEMWSPMAIAVIGGLAVSTILTLIYVPTMYCIFGGVGIKRQRRKMRKQLDAYFEEQANN